MLVRISLATSTVEIYTRGLYDWSHYRYAYLCGFCVCVILWNLVLEQTTRCVWGHHDWYKWQVLDKKTTVDSDGIMTYYQSRTCRGCGKCYIKVNKTNYEH